METTSPYSPDEFRGYWDGNGTSKLLINMDKWGMDKWGMEMRDGEMRDGYCIIIDCI